MNLQRFKRPRVYIPTVLVALLVITLFVIFNASFQKNMLLKYAGPEMDALSVEHIHLTPWSLTIDQLQAAYQGGNFSIEHGSVKYCLSSLILFNLNIKEIIFRSVAIDIAEFKPPKSEEETPPTGIFPGILASLDHGLGYTLDNIQIDADIKLPENQSIDLHIKGGGIKPKQTGDINLDAQFYTGVENELISVSNKLMLDQQKRGEFSLLENMLNIDLALAALPHKENVSIAFTATPDVLTDELKAHCKEQKVDCLTPENYSILIQQDNEAGENRSMLNINGQYNGNSGWYTGGYDFTANERLVQPYMGDKKIPPTQEKLTGDFNLQLTDITGDITFVSDLQLSDLKQATDSDKAPQLLELKNNIHVFLLPENKLRIVQFDAGVTDEGATRPLAAKIPAEMDIPLNDIESFLKQDNTLLEFELPEIPIAWLDFLTPDYEITDGRLSGRFEVSTDQQSVIHLTPKEPLIISNLTVMQAGETLIDNFKISLLPSVAYSNESVNITLDDFSVKSKHGTLVNAETKTTAFLAGEQTGKVKLSANANINVHNALIYTQDHDYAGTSVPKSFRFDLNTSLTQKPDTDKVTISQLDANIKKDKTRLLKLGLSQPLVLNTSDGSNLIASSKGNIAQLKISDIELNWFSAFIPDTELEGSVQNAEIKLSMDASRNAVINTSQPISIKNVNVSSNNKLMLENVGLDVSPMIVLNDKGVDIAYEDLLVTGNADKLISGKGKIFLSQDKQQGISMSGKLDVDLQAVTKQPALIDALQASIVSPVNFEADYEMAVTDNSINIDTLSANLFYADLQPRIALSAESKISVRTKLEANESEMGRARGKISFTIQNLTPEPFAEILAVKGMNFKDVSGRATLISDGETLKLDSIEPFTITEINISDEQGDVLHPFDVFLGADLNMQGNELNIQVEPFGLAFTTHNEGKTIDGKLSAILTDNEGITWVNHLDTHLIVSLPELLDQPVILPKHKLKTGSLDANINLNADGQLDALFKVDNLTANRELPLELLELSVEGQVDTDTSFVLEAPFKTEGKTGNTDMLIKAKHKHIDDQNNIIHASMDSSEFYLNDILDFLNAISSTIKERRGQPEEAVEEEVVIENDITPDEIAFWDVIPYDIDTQLSIDKLYYTEFLIIHSIEGETIVSPRELHLKGFKAYFHDSPITLDSDIAHTSGIKPYALEINAGVEDFNMKQFFNELLPSATPRSEGLFNISLNANGQTPNMSQLRNDLLFDLHLHSEDGVFRLLDPDSALVGGATNVLGAVGEGVSYIPTGLFGLGAVSRLVDYIKVIDYDLMEINLVRDETQNVEVKEYVVQNSEFLMTANGGIKFQQDKDILNSPLDMTAHLDFRGKGAAIMYDLNLLEDERNEYGYWKGPKIDFWGTPANNESNLDDVVSTAGSAAVLGGITRPISGLIGNFKHRWFGDNDDPVPYKGYQVDDSEIEDEN